MIPPELAALRVAMNTLTDGGCHTWHGGNGEMQCIAITPEGQATILALLDRVAALEGALRKARGLLGMVSHEADCEQSLIYAWARDIAGIDAALSPAS